MSEATACGAGNGCCGGAAPIVGKSCAYRSPEEAVELLRADAGDIQATTVTLDRSGAEKIEAERVTLDRSGARDIQARSAQLDRSGVALLKSERTVLQQSSAVAVMTSEARLVRTKAVAVVSGNTAVEGNLRTLVHVGPVSGGTVRTLVDPAGAIGFGAALGLVLLLFGRLFRRLAGS